MAPCSHLNEVRQGTRSANGGEDCLKIGDSWVHLRLWMICGHVACCDSSNNKHATKHFHAPRTGSCNPLSQERTEGGGTSMRSFSNPPDASRTLILIGDQNHRRSALGLSMREGENRGTDARAHQ
jgi:hypothetical protein